MNTAIGNANFNWFTSVVNATGGLIEALVPLLLAVALLVFIWGVVKFISTDEDSERSDGKKKMAWGVFGLFIIVSAWGLVILLQTLLGIEGANAINPPQVPDWRANGASTR